ncbi:MAG: histidinol-phosphate transaminase [Candidatus Omnitrophota bacterium]
MLPRKNILKIEPYQPGKPIETVKRELRLDKVIKLASNENALGPSPRAVRAIKEALEGINRYPDSDCFYLKKKLAEKLVVSAGNLVFGCGADEIIVLALRAFVDPGDEVVIARPTFLIYQIAALAADAKITFVPQKDFRYDLKAIKQALTAKTKIVFIANPDNPSGTYVNKEEVREFMRGLPADTVVFFDEAYYELAEKEDFPNTLDYLDEYNVVIARTFSKAYGLSGLRIGYGIARPEIIGYLNRVREPFNVNILAQAAALAALDDDEHLRRTLSLLREGKSYLYENLRKMNLSYIESVTNFILINMGGNACGICRQLLEQGIIVRDMNAWGMADFIRVTVGTMAENKTFITALGKIKNNQ